ncbi:MAG: hypothetical protein AB7F35_30875 [Acetobacteraceae bacterium]
MPGSDDPGTGARLGVVHDPQEVPAQFERGGKFATLGVGFADCGGGQLVNHEHVRTRAHATAVRKRLINLIEEIPGSSEVRWDQVILRIRLARLMVDLRRAADDENIRCQIAHVAQYDGQTKLRNDGS